MARQKALSEWVLGNGNLKAGHRSLITGQSGKPILSLIWATGMNKEKCYAKDYLQPAGRQTGDN